MFSQENILPEEPKGEILPYTSPPSPESGLNNKNTFAGSENSENFPGIISTNPTKNIFGICKSILATHNYDKYIF